jgi:hypothetical protein
MTDIEGKNVESTTKSCAFRNLIAKPLPSLILMTSSSEFP